MDRFEGPTLTQLAADGCTDEILKAIQGGVDAAQNDNAALRFAVNGGHVSTINALLEAGAKADKKMLIAATRLGKVESFKSLLDIDVPCDPMELAYAFYNKDFATKDAELLAILFSEKNFPAFELTDANSPFRVVDEFATKALSDVNVELFLLTIALGAKVIDPVGAFASLFSATSPPLRHVLRAANIAKPVLGLTATHLLAVEKEIAQNEESYYEYGWHAASKVFSKWRSGEFNRMSAQELDDYDRKERQREFPH